LKKYFSIGINKPTDAAFIKKAAGIAVSHSDDASFSGNELAEKLCLSREQTHRKIKQATTLSTGKFIRYIRILKAYGYLLEGNFSVSEISYKVGFEDPSYFNKCFREETDVSPGEVKKSGDVAGLIKTPLFPFYEISEIKHQLQKNGIIFQFPPQAKEERAVPKRWLIGGTIVTVLLFSLFFLTRNKRSTNKIDLGDNSRIVVLPFVNQTGDSSLEHIGDMAGSWISNQLGELKTIRTVPYFTVKQYQSYIGVLPHDPDKRPTFRELVAARYMISGDYYLKEDRIYFNARFVDASTLQPLYDFPVMQGDKDSVMEVIERVRLKIAGLITNLEEVKLGKRNPPDYEAYKAFLTGLHQMTVGLATPESRFYLEKAAALEPDFVMPRIFLSWFYQGKKLDSLLQQIARISTITKYEKNVYDQMFHLWNHNYKASLKIALQSLEEYPGDYFFNLFAGHNAKSLFMPGLAIKVLSQVHEPLPNNEGGMWHYYKVWNYTESLIMLGRHQEAIDYLQSIPLKNYNLAVPHLLINVQVKLGKSREEIESLIVEIGNEKMKYLTDRYNVDKHKAFAEYHTAAAYEFYLAGDMEGARYFAKQATAFFARIHGQKGYKYDIIDALYLSGNLPKTKKGLQEQLKKNRSDDELLIYLAQAEAAMGNEQDAFKIMAKYDTVSRLYWRRHEFQYEKNYLKARIFALLGKKDQAVSLLKKALENGQLCHYHDFGRDIFLRSLFDYAPFREMIQPVDLVDSTMKQ
jgi:AraC-like DNA-binding protein/TolB-like protein